jgi:chemotaxis protein MotB
MWNNLSKGLLAAVVAAGGLAAYLFLNQGALRQQADENEKKAQAMEQQLAQAKGEVDKLAKEKEAELAKLKQAQNDMLQSLKKEVEAGEVMVNQLADRLSVKILDKILFTSGEATISAKGQNVLKRVGKVLAQARDKDKVVRIEGHTDNVPIGKNIVEKFPTNWELSTARATTVVRFMAETSKIPPDGFEAAGLGEYHPIADNAKPEGRQQNRRIEIILYPRVASLAQELPKAKEQPAAVEIKPAQ